MRRSVRSLVGLAGCAALLAGCYTSAGDGKLKVQWKIGGTSCAAANVDRVRLHVIEDLADIVPPVLAACVDGAYVIPEVPVGRYTVQVEGIDINSAKALYEGHLDNVAVSKDRTTTTDWIQLAMRPSGLRVTWRFQDGGLCSGKAVAAVEVTVFDSHSKIVAQNAGKNTVPCDPPVTKDNPGGGVLYGGLAGDENHSITVYGLDASGARIYVGKAQVKTTPGEDSAIDIPLASCQGNPDC